MGVLFLGKHVSWNHINTFNTINKDVEPLQMFVCKIYSFDAAYRLLFFYENAHLLCMMYDHYVKM